MANQADQQARPTNGPHQSPVVVRNRAVSRVRRLTTAIGIVSTTAAVGLGILASSQTPAHSASVSKTTGTAASTTPTTATSSSSSGSSATSSVSSSTDGQTTTTTSAPTSTGSGAVTTSGQT